MTEYLEKFLNSRVCDVVEDATNTQTFEEYMEESEETFGIDRPLFYTVEDLEKYLDFLDELWNK